MTELAVRDAYQPDRVIQRSGGIYERDIIDGWVQVLDDVSKLASYIAETDFVPKTLRNRPAAIAACILTGRELGIGPMQSLKSIYMVQGIPSLSAEYKRARALAAGHDITIDETTATRCIIRGRRAGTDRWVTITWTMDMANRAKLSGKDIWRQYPQRMLQARASGELCDLLFPDASLGLATTEVLEDGGITTADGQVVDAATGEVVTSAQPAAIDAPKQPRTAQRAARKTSPPAPPAAAQAAPPSGGSTGGDLPPLPGEDEPPLPPVNLLQNGVPDPSPVPGDDPVTSKQLTAIWTVLTREFSFADNDADKEVARMACGLIIGRDITSTKELSKREAGTIIDTLAHWQHQAGEQGGDPRDWMTAGLKAAEEAREVRGE